MFILDCSVTMAWLFEDEKTSFTEKILNRLEESGAFVPSLWYSEVINVLLVGEKRKRLTPAQSIHFLQVLSSLPITVDEQPIGQKSESILLLARSYELSSYDAAYLDIALRMGYPLATLDQKLKKACKSAGCEVL